MIVKKTPLVYPANKTSSNVRTLEDVKKDMEWEKQTIQNLRESIEDYDNGWSDDFEDNPRKRARMEQRLEAAKENYTKLKTEYESHPGYYADKYKDAGWGEKVTTGILGSTIATVPVVAETTAAALKEAETKLSAEDYTSALRAEEIAKNKMNDYANSFFGSFDMIDQDELNRLSQEYQQAKEYRKSLEPKYEQPVDMDSWGMKLMEESAWLKNSANENLDGILKTGADIAIDMGQDVALLPLMLGGPWAYIAGVATNAAAEDMYEKTAAGKAASKALGSGVLTAGAETAMGALAEAKIPVKELLKKIGMGGENLLTKSLENMGIPATKEAVNYVIDFLTDKAGRDPEAKFSAIELFLNAIKGGITGFAGSKTKGLRTEIEKVWDQLGE